MRVQRLSYWRFADMTLIERVVIMNRFGAFRNSIRFLLRAEAKFTWWTQARTSRAPAPALWTVWKFSREFCTRVNFPSLFRAGLTIRVLCALAEKHPSQSL